MISVIFRRPRALSEIEAKIGTQIAWGGGQWGRVSSLPVRVGGIEYQDSWI